MISKTTSPLWRGSNVLQIVLVQNHCLVPPPSLFNQNWQPITRVMRLWNWVRVICDVCKACFAWKNIFFNEGTHSNIMNSGPPQHFTHTQNKPTYNPPPTTASTTQNAPTIPDRILTLLMNTHENHYSTKWHSVCATISAANFSPTLYIPNIEYLSG